jgi:hypothetical protein
MYFLFLYFMEGSIYTIRLELFFLPPEGSTPFLGFEGLTVKDKSQLLKGAKR